MRICTTDNFVGNTFAMNQTTYFIEPLEAPSIREEILANPKSLEEFAAELKINLEHIGLEDINMKDVPHKLSDFELNFILKIIRMTNLSAEDLYDELTVFFPRLSKYSLIKCVERSILQKRLAARSKSALQ